ncbi:MAG: DUF6106 family protein [Lachnospiraceae bacterium]|nr:DUF6106 family protein [Lachnospiraceae bacterium]
MNESYVECMVARKSSPVNAILKYLIYILAVASGLIVLMGYIIFIVPLIIFGLLAFLWVPGLDLEYEYLYLDREISIDKILSKQKRKKVRTIELSKMEKMCPIKSHELDSYKARNVKVSDYSSGIDDAPVWVIVYKSEREEELIGFEPNEDMLKAIKNVYPRKVIEY